MEVIKNYLLSITAAALICGFVNSLVTGNSSVSKLLKLLSGLFLAITVIKPAINIQITDIRGFAEQLAVSADLAVADGEHFASAQMKRIIKEKTEAYILDKAKTFGADLNVEVVLDDIVPVGVMLSGDISPFGKNSLCETISQDLGIPVEEQIWN